MLHEITEPLIGPPPELHDRVSELEYVAQRYRRPHTPRDMYKILDLDHPKFFSKRLRSVGLPPHYDELNDVAKKLVPIILWHKNFYGTLRPHELAQKVGVKFPYDRLKSARTAAYPSGHTAQAYAIAYRLSELYPMYSALWFDTAKKVAASRIDRGVHLPSDNEGGKALAYKLYTLNRANL